MADRLAENGAIQYALANPEAGSKRAALSGYIMGALTDWLKNPFPPSSRLAAPGRLRGKFFDSGIAPLAMDFTSGQYASGSAGTMAMKSFSDIITFSRTSNATITKSDGTIGYAPHNLLTYSEQFDNAAWSKTTTTVTANAIASPAGTTTGDTLTAGGANSTTLHSYTAIAQPYTFSIYIRRRTGTGAIEITADGSTYVAKTITSDWQRFDTTITPTAGTRTPGVRIVTSGDAIDVWGAQLEIGSTATTYNPTTVKNLLGYTEAFDNAAWTKSNSFVQTNLLTYSEAFDNAAWSKTTITATANSIVAPNGYQTADTLAATGANSTALQTFTASAVPYTFSVYLYRKTGSGNIDITVDGTTWVTKTITSGWTRVDTTLTPAAGSKTAGIRIATSGDEIYAWGAQLVQGSTAGDYRRTDAAALPVFYPNYNGVVCAEKLVENTASTFHYINTASTAAGTYTYSVYAKAGERTFVLLTNGSAGCYFNLSTGVAGTPGAGITANIVSAGNGYYRCSITFTSAISFICYTYIANSISTINYAGDGTSGIYIFGAQLSDSASLDPYVLNAAAAPSAQAYYGARFDYDPVTLAPKGLLIEEQRVNLLTYSDDFSDVSWTKNTAGVASLPAVTANYALAPSGAIVADRIIYNLNSGTATADLSEIRKTVTTTAVTHTLSFWVKSTDGVSSYQMLVRDPNGFTNQIIVSGTWTRYILSAATYPAGSASIGFGVRGGQTPVNSNAPDILIWGAQLEAGAFATSYIPTAASSVTRAADVAVIQGSNFYSWYNQNEGSVLINVLNNGLNVNVSYVNINDGSTSNVLAHYYNNVTTQSAFAQTTNGAVQANIILTSGTVLNNTLKANGAYKVNDFAFSVNSSSVGTDTSGITSIATQLNIGRNATGTATSIMNGTIKQISYYNTRLQNSVLQSLTA